jgi:hypothetical protein
MPMNSVTEADRADDTVPQATRPDHATDGQRLCRKKRAVLSMRSMGFFFWVSLWRYVLRNGNVRGCGCVPVSDCRLYDSIPVPRWIFSP